MLCVCLNTNLYLESGACEIFRSMALTVCELYIMKGLILVSVPPAYHDLQYSVLLRMLIHGFH